MSLPAIIGDIRTPEIFRQRCEERARLFAAGKLDLHEAVDVLQVAAQLDGLVGKIGQDAVQHIMATAFRAVRNDLP
jgi:hypothetical protein